MVKILKKDGKTYLLLDGNYNIIKAKEGLYLLYSNEKLIESIKKEKEDKEKISKNNLKKKDKERREKRKTEREELNNREIDLLIKVSLIRFVDREWNKVMSMLKKGEQIILKSLIKRGFVKTFKKNGRQYITFTEEMYERLKEETQKRIGKEKKEIVNIENNFFIIPKEHVKNATKNIDFSNYSYVIGSDGTLFIADKKKAKYLYKKILPLLKKEKMSHVELAKKLKIREEIVLIVLKLMCEEGIVYEPEKNIFEVVE